MESVKSESKLSVVLPPISPVTGAAASASSMEIDPMTPREFDSEPHVGGIGGLTMGTSSVPVVTPIAAPPALRLTEAQVGGVPSAPSMSYDSRDQDASTYTISGFAEANETQEAAVLLTALSAIATKEVHVDGVTGLLSLATSSSSSGSSPSSSRPIPPLPDLGKRKQPPSRQQIFRSLCTVDENHGGEAAEDNQQQQQQHHQVMMQHHVHAPVPHAITVSPQDSMRARAVSIDAVMGVASELSLPCEPCYPENDNTDAEMQQQAPSSAQVQVPGLSVAFAAETGGFAANLVSPPSSPAFRPRSHHRNKGGGVSSSPKSPRSADRRKRFLDLHGTDCAAFQLPPPPTASSPVTTTVMSRCKLEGSDLPPSHQGALQPVEALQGRIVRIILRKKFSWKNYPELERFLIANREEYLRHSALNYTVQQKRYNNRLTERLLQLATEHAYVFDESDFSFVTVRDRIRCYFKSYVQSSKKKGLVVGYAARRAGLMTRDELERSAGTAGMIVVPGSKQAQA